MKKEYEFDRKQVENDLFATYKVGNLKGRRTRTFLRAMSRKIEHAYEIGIRDANLKKPLIQPEELSGLTSDSPLERGIMQRVYDAYKAGFEAGKKEA